MLPIDIIKKYYPEDSLAYFYFYNHSVAVKEKAIEIANNNIDLKPDIDFITSGAMLHDIGIIFTNAPQIGCFGTYNYICHGYLGRELLEKEGLSEIAKICETHIGVGLTVEDIEKDNLPIPNRDMLPTSIEEKIICVADKFYSKNMKQLTTPKSVEEIFKDIERFGKEKPLKLKEMFDLLKIKY
ncbi:MAG: HD domain-containing protein [Bacteroidales bacterium]|jgi:uncharacterized protein